MHAKIMLGVCVVVAIVALCQANPLQYNNYNGKYTVSALNSNDGNYHAQDDGRYHSQNEDLNGVQDSLGRYHHTAQPYYHVHDNRELGVYHHIPYPYDGGYGPYAGLNIPYVHDARPYNHDLYTSTTTKKPTTTTKRTTTTTTTTTTPRSISYKFEDEGKYRVVQQEDLRHKDKYDHAYHTENGIYGEEQAKLHHTGGTHAKGYYEYTGDDGMLYKVNYKSNDGGFMPEGEHIPTPPPIPEAIARAIKYVEELHKANGDKPLYDHRGFRINHMTKDIKAQIKSMHIEEMPKDLGDQIRMLQHEVELAEAEEEREKLEELEELPELDSNLS